MRTFALYRLIAVSICILFCLSCGSSKQPARKELEQNKCEQMALDHSTNKLRAYGVAVSQNKSFARDNAILTARRELGGTIEAALSSLFTRYRQEHTLGTEADFVEKSSQAVKEVIDQTIQYAPVICSSSYELANGNIETHVCIELQADWQQQIYDTIRQQAKDRIDMDASKMKEELDQEVEKLRERKGL